MLSDVFENFRNLCIEIYELDAACFLTAPGLAWPVALKKKLKKTLKRKIRSFNWYWYVINGSKIN